MSVHVHIEHLVLDGLPVGAADGPAVQAAVQAELARLLGGGGLGDAYRQGGALAHVRGADVRMDLSASPEALGRQIAESLHGSLRA